MTSPAKIAHLIFNIRKKVEIREVSIIFLIIHIIRLYQLNLQNIYYFNALQMSHWKEAFYESRF